MGKSSGDTILYTILWYKQRTERKKILGNYKRQDTTYTINILVFLFYYFYFQITLVDGKNYLNCKKDHLIILNKR